jgi:hypothetical protein
MKTRKAYVRPSIRNYGDLKAVTAITVLPGKELGSADGLVLTQSGQPVPVESVS